MAKKAETAKANSISIDQDWRARDDANDLMRVAQLQRDRKRFKRAMDFVRGALRFNGDRSNSRSGGRR